MRLLWWQQLPLLILIQLLEPTQSSHKLCALLAFKSAVVGPPQFSSSVGRYPCLRQWRRANCNRLKNLCVVSLHSRIHPPSQNFRKIKFSPLTSNLSPMRTSLRSQAKLFKQRNLRTVPTTHRNNDVPTLTPWQAAQVKKPRKKKVTAIVGAAVAALLVVITVVLVYICLIRFRRITRQTSETASSLPSPPVECERGNIAHHFVAFSPYSTHNMRQLTISELEQATCNFSPSNIIGEGGFGLVYKGLLQDGSIVAVKRRLLFPNPYLVHEIKRMACVHHRHIVKLVGYCEESHQQLLVYDYHSNGNVGNHLYDGDGLPVGKLEMRQRLLIALGAAKGSCTLLYLISLLFLTYLSNLQFGIGLEHLHSLVPPLLHMHFRTSNVLLDENFTAKVSDFGLSKFLVEGNHAGSSSTFDYYLAPELKFSKDFSERGDVYSFGVFLLEVISGREAFGRNQSDSLLKQALQARKIPGLDIFVDKTLGGQAMDAAGQVLELALMCTDTSARRPAMKSVVEELERICEREMGNPHSELGEEIGAVTLGSELFK
ncbi:probable serine/threonine-protein kinase PBL28 isoform X2 [Malania oleifera]|uniref:probable serine/threonine-protein kinase PBL28 isoform X2 n=1 Tax=Malania oleifera TaxID=397392 RepID=UPI0025AE05E0|nr:probable serine/threonine-protein kinase PBL28 isoform X2 [Malania oleifera]